MNSLTQIEKTHVEQAFQRSDSERTHTELLTSSIL